MDIVNKIIENLSYLSNIDGECLKNCGLKDYSIFFTILSNKECSSNNKNLKDYQLNDLFEINLKNKKIFF
jgi:hypothetical protein